MATKTFNQSLVANGTSNGTLTVNSSSGFEVGATVFLAAKNERIQQLKVASKPDSTSVIVTTLADAQFDASAFTVVKSAKLFQPKDSLLIPSDPPAQPFYSGTVTKTTTIAVPNGGTELVLNGDTGNVLVIKKNNVQTAVIDVDGNFTGNFTGLVSYSALSTSANVTYWVDAAAGSDNNSGLASNASFATINKALSLLPSEIGHTITINIKAGTYAETINLSKFSSFLSGTPQITFVGQDWVTPTLTTGSTTGTFDSSFAGLSDTFTAKCTGANWTVDELKGKYIRVTGLTVGSTNYWPIASNTANTITLPLPVDGKAAALAGTWTSKVFNIFEQGVKIVAPSPGTHNATSGLISMGNVPTRFDNISINHTGFAFGVNIGQVRAGQSFSMLQCKITSQTTVSATALNLAGSTTLQRCYLSGQGATTFRGIFISTTSPSVASNGSFNAGVIDGCTNQNAIQISGNSGFNFGGVIQNCANSGIVHSGTSGTINESGNAHNSYLMMKNVTQPAIRIDGGADYIAENTAQGTRYFINCGAGIQFNSTSKNSNANLRDFIFDNCTTAVNIGGRNISIDLSGSTIKDSTTAVNFSTTAKFSRFNQVRVSSTTQMTNCTNEFLIDGAANTTLTSLRANSNKDITESLTLNRLLEL